MANNIIDLTVDTEPCSTLVRDKSKQIENYRVAQNQNDRKSSVKTSAAEVVRKKSLVISIDIGRSNCATTIFDLVSNEIIYWQNRAIFDKGDKLSPEAVALKVLSYITELHSKFSVKERTFIALIESQPKFIAFKGSHGAFFDNGTIATAFFSIFTTLGIQTKTISPKSVSSFFKIKHTSRNSKKKATINQVIEHLTNKAIKIKDSERRNFEQAKKKDDLADSYLQLQYYLHEHHNE